MSRDNEKLIVALLILMLGVIAVASCGCVPTADTPLHLESPSTIETSSRFTVKRVGVFADDLAYNNRRGIYIVIDNETGDEYVGVSGVGISELGIHQAGKNDQMPDER